MIYRIYIRLFFCFFFGYLNVGLVAKAEDIVVDEDRVKKNLLLPSAREYNPEDYAPDELRLYNCTAMELLDLLKQDMSQYNKKELDNHGKSAQGGEIVYFYDNDNKLISIKSSYYGETGRRENFYYFLDSSLDSYVIKTTIYYYSNLIFSPRVQLGGLSKDLFLVCEKEYMGLFLGDSDKYYSILEEGLIEYLDYWHQQNH